MKLPKAKTDNIVVQSLRDETLIYDLSTSQAFCLNDTSAKVFNACDGQTTLDELKQKFQLSDEIIYLALDGLKKENLIIDEYVSPFAGLSRREVIRRVGLVSMIALPIVSSLVAPPAITAASGNCTCTAPANLNARVQGCPCGSNNDCCGVCLVNGGNPVCSAPTAGAQPTAAACCPRLLV